MGSRDCRSRACGEACIVATMGHLQAADPLDSASVVCVDCRVPRHARARHGGPHPGSVAIHALTVGGIGGLTVGMMTRTARGHTGRVLQAGNLEVCSYVLIQL